MVSAKNTQFDSTGLKNNLNSALQDFISNSDTSFAYNKKSTTYSMLVNRNYSSTSFGTTSQHLAKAIKALADLGLDGSGQTIIYVKATLTNCAGQKEESNILEVTLTNGTAYSGTGTLRAACAATYARNLAEVVVTEPCGDDFTCELREYTDSGNKFVKKLPTEFEYRSEEEQDYKCIVQPSDITFSRLEEQYVL